MDFDFYMVYSDFFDIQAGYNYKITTNNEHLDGKYFI